MQSALRRLRPRLLPILQTAAAAVAAYYLALALPLSDRRPVFASIAAVVALGVSYDRRGRRAAELIAGVVVGLTVADLIVHLIGNGPFAIALLIVLAMGAAVMLGGSELVISEAAVSGLLLASLPTSDSFTIDRVVEAAVGGAVAMVVATVFFPPDPALMVRRAAQTVFRKLGETLAGVADALAAGDPDRAEAALRTARSIDGDLDALEKALGTARETARLAPPKRAARGFLGRHARALPQLDFAVRNVRVLARHALRYTRARLPAPAGLDAAVRELASGVATLGSALEEPEIASEARGHAQVAAAHAREVFEREPDFALTEIISQVRSTAVDVMRAADLVGAVASTPDDVHTEQLLASPPPSSD